MTAALAVLAMVLLVFLALCVQRRWQDEEDREEMLERGICPDCMGFLTKCNHPRKP